LFANIVVEIPYQIAAGLLTWATYYYAVVGVQSSDRQVLVLLLVIQLFLFASSFAHLTIVALPDAQTAAGIVTLITLLITVFCGVLQAPKALPGFWIFIYRVSPFTYWISGIASTQLHSREIDCSISETSIFSPPTGQNCGEYLQSYLTTATGYLLNPNDTAACHYCAFRNADIYLSGSDIYWSDRWRNFGIMWAFILFNLFGAVVLYYIFRVRKWSSGGGKESKAPPFAQKNTHDDEMALEMRNMEGEGSA